MTTRLRPLALATLIALVAALLAAAPPLAEPARAQDPLPPEQDAAVTRIAGDGPVGTAIALAQATFDSADTVVLARVDDYADALAGAVLAAQLPAPVLFTETAALSDGVLQAIQGLGATSVEVLGGTAAVSAAVEQELVDAGLTVTRTAGANRFETAGAIAESVLGDATPAVVYFVEGENVDPARGWPDAVNAGALAAAQGQPILPVNAEFVPPATAAQWAQWREAGAVGIIVGGTGAVSDAVAAELAGVDADGEPNEPLARIAGDDRFGTSAAAYAYAVSELLFDPATRHVIPGGSFVEGIAAAAVGGRDGNPLVMVDSTDPAGSPGTIGLLGSAIDLTDTTVLIGDETAIAPAVADAIRAAVAPADVESATCLTLLHHNDGESQLLGTGDDDAFGSLARLVTLAQQEQAAAEAEGCAPVTVTSGDNFLAGPELSASDPTAATGPVLDAVGLSLVGYDALALGNHDFDFGPDFTARFIDAFDPEVPFLSANLDVSGVPALQALADRGLVAPRVTVDAGGTDVGIIGLTTPALRSISSPGDVVVQQAVVDIVQGEIDELATEGVEHVVLISHLQGLSADLDLVGQLSGLDVVVAGGGDEVLAEPADPLVPGDLGSVFDTYPIELTDADGDVVPTVTTAGDYKYLGRLTLRFGEDGELLADAPYDAQTSRMLRVADAELPGGVERDATVVEQVEEPVRDFVAGLADNVIATSEVGLNGARPDIRQQETNLGNLVADAHRFTVQQAAEEFGLDPDAPIVAFQNGGGIRNNDVIPAGDVTELDTFDVLPFSNFIGAVEDFGVDELKAVLEQGYSAVEFAAGSFIHLSDNVEVTIDLGEQAQEVEVDDQGQVTVTTAGERVRELVIDGTTVIEGGEVVAPEFTMTLVTVDFSLRNGDAYPFNLGEDGFTVVGTSYQQSLAGYLEAPAADGGLAGQITAADYPEGGEGRITITGM